MRKCFHLFVLFIPLTIPPSLYAQKQLFLTGGPEISNLGYDYKFQQSGTILRRGWVDPGGHRANGIKLGLNLSLHYRLSEQFAVETGFRFSELNVLVHDSRFLNDHEIGGSNPKNNLNGTYPDKGNFNITEWYGSNYVSGYFFMRTRSRIQPYLSAGLAWSYFASLHADISSSYLHTSTGEYLEVKGHYVPGYGSAFIEAGAHYFPDRSKHNHGPAIFVGLKYSRSGNVVSGDYQNTQNGNAVYTDHFAATASCLSLSVRVGVFLSKKEITYK